MTDRWTFQLPDCLGKTRYNTPADAHRQLAFRGKRAKGSRGAQKVYPCDHCSGYHVGALAFREGKKL